jgi:hypothetical protein
MEKHAAQNSRSTNPREQAQANCRTQSHATPALKIHRARLHTPRKTNLLQLKDLSFVLFADVQNFVYGSQCRPQWGELHRQLREVYPEGELRAIFTSTRFCRLSRSLQEIGYKVVAGMARYRHGHSGPLCPNADEFLLQDIERILSQMPEHFNAVLIGTGDLALAVRSAKLVRHYSPAAKIFTLSKASNTSPRMYDRPDIFAGNILLGWDLLVRKSAAFAAQLSVAHGFHDGFPAFSESGSAPVYEFRQE